MRTREPAHRATGRRVRVPRRQASSARPTGQVRNGEHRARAVLRNGDGDSRRRAASQGLGCGAFDADGLREPNRGGAASSRSSEMTRAAMAHGGVTVPERGGDKRRSRRRLGTESRGERRQERAQTHPRCVRMIGDDGEGRRRRQSTRKYGRGSYGKSRMVTRRGQPRKRSSAWT